MTIARRHHFVSQFYLAGFTSDGTQDGEIFSFDTHQRKVWKTVTKEIALERDFNAVPAEIGITDELEKQLSTFEDQAAPVFRRIRELKAIPEGDDFSYLINFIALVGVRRPSMRKQIDSLQTEILRTHLKIYLSSPETWKDYCERAKQDGLTGIEDLSYEDARKTLLGQEWNIRSHPSYFHPIEFEILDGLIKLLARRDWSLVIAPSDTHFITSDQPVNLIWTFTGKKPFFGPGYASKNSMVIFPVSKELCLLGKFHAANVTKEAQRILVATANSIVMMHCARFAYSPTERFHCLKEDMSIAKSDIFFSGSAPGGR
jgi:hypothetical protein